MKKYATPFFVLVVFVSIVAVVAVLRINGWYFAMFTMIGGMAMGQVLLTWRYPRLRQPIRLIQLSALGIFLFAGLSLRLNVNFQFIQVIFDGTAGIVSGALIQLLIARVGPVGATVTRGVMGFGPTSHIRTARILDISTDLPVIIEIADSEEHINGFLPVLHDLFESTGCGGLVTVEHVTVIRYAQGCSDF